MKITILGKLESVSETPDGRSSTEQANPHSAAETENIEYSITISSGVCEVFRRDLFRELREAKFLWGRVYQKAKLLQKCHLRLPRE